ncbi:MAG TPA: hypothetical protein PK228_11920 [Saprospiraceae bacterium]|nr:hypothetical protein [Saprospiraceae bacterium]
MKNPGIATPKSDDIRLVLEAQNENLQHLLDIVSGITGENMSDLRTTLTERLKQMEEIEQQIWETLFPTCTTAEHRMTMIPSQRLEHNYGGIW